MSTNGSVVGVDVGGTFTDLFYYDEDAARFRTAKVPSNRGDEAIGFLEGLKTFGPLAQLGSIVHGTTVGTNALLERKGARIGLITVKMTGVMVTTLLPALIIVTAGPGFLAISRSLATLSR